MAMSTMFLLVHGAWQGAWVWDEVKKLLRNRGFSSTAIELPGSGNDNTDPAQATLASYVTCIANKAAEFGNNRVVLVGHSMGGAAITAAAAEHPELFDRLIYVCAFVPQTGESVAELAKRSHEMGAPGPQSTLTQDGAALQLVNGSIIETFLHDCAPKTASRLVPLFGPQPVAPLVTPLGERNTATTVQKSYIRCRMDQAVDPSLQQLMAEREGITDIRDIDSGHEPFFSQPKLLVEHMLDAAQGDLST